MGETSKTLHEIQEWVKQQNASEFTGNKYNPMNHNCNNFSDAFLKFLNGKQVPSEILNQAGDLLDKVGSLVNNIFGINTPKTNVFTPE